MTSFDLRHTVLDECKKYDFSSDIRQVFTSLKDNALVVNALKIKSNEYQNSGSNLLYDLVLYAYLSQGKFFFPTFKYEVNSLVFDKNLPRLCLTLHSNFSPLMSALIKQKCLFAMVSDYPDVIKRVAFNTGIRSGKIDLISGNEACLLRVKKLLKKNYFVNSTIDFKTSIPGRYIFLSDSMLKLALFLRPITLFGVNFVNDFGELIFITKDIDLDNGLDEIKQDIMNFISTYKENTKYEFSKFDYLVNNVNLMKEHRSKLSTS
jgi:hypothetical protein